MPSGQHLAFPLPEVNFGNLRSMPGGGMTRVKGGELEEGDGGVKVSYADAWLRSR